GAILPMIQPVALLPSRPLANEQRHVLEFGPLLPALANDALALSIGHLHAVFVTTVGTALAVPILQHRQVPHRHRHDLSNSERGTRNAVSLSKLKDSGGKCKSFRAPPSDS